MLHSAILEIQLKTLPCCKFLDINTFIYSKVATWIILPLSLELFLHLSTTDNALIGCIKAAYFQTQNGCLAEPVSAAQ